MEEQIIDGRKGTESSRAVKNVNRRCWGGQDRNKRYMYSKENYMNGSSIRRGTVRKGNRGERKGAGQ